jgi:hypothetical protein
LYVINSLFIYKKKLEYPLCMLLCIAVENINTHAFISKLFKSTDEVNVISGKPAGTYISIMYFKCNIDLTL